MFSPDGTLISASAAPHCGITNYNKHWQTQCFLTKLVTVISTLLPLQIPEDVLFSQVGTDWKRSRLLEVRRQYTLWFAYCVGLYSCKVVLGDCAFKPYYFELISNSLRSVQANIFDCSTFLVSFLFYCNCQSGNFTVHVCCQSFTFHFESAFFHSNCQLGNFTVPVCCQSFTFYFTTDLGWVKL